MMKDVLDYINSIPEGSPVVIHLTNGTTQWRASRSVNKLLIGRMGRHRVKRTMVTYDSEGTKIYHIYPAD